ncbi:hypothetical protein C1H46_028095 [Malus baccata]|uniref:Aspartic peptidase DDI1-type domain-containing protein n=1 Tax=Malus baccata TaxID=106549 RepID=A0A540LIN8_MALBA|nr:hypothetical protein C1H46_028095 [Malus baccata]
MIVLLDIDNQDDEPTEFHNCPSKEDPTTDHLCHMLELFSIPGLGMGHPMCLQGSIGSTTIRVLIDSSAACNLLSLDIAQKLDLAIENINPVQFTTASHKKVHAHLRAHNVTINLQDYTLLGSFLLLNIPGYDLILGAEWLEPLGYIGWHFRNKTMLFIVNNKTYTLQGLITTQPTFHPCTSAHSSSHYPHPYLQPTTPPILFFSTTHFSY